MKGKAIVLYRNGSSTEHTYEGETPDLIFLQGAVEGFIEKVPLWDYLDEEQTQPCVVYCNEDGKNKGLEPNYPATRRWARALIHGGHAMPLNDILVGDVVILTGDQAFMEAL